MQSKNNPKSAAEKQWHESVAEFAKESGWLNRYGVGTTHFHLDHFLGAQAKRKVNLISTKVGEYAVNPIPVELHDVHSNHPLNITHSKRAFIEIYGTPGELFKRMVKRMKDDGYNIPFNDDILEAIVNG